jgi:S1-C subfamily serine protease
MTSILTAVLLGLSLVWFPGFAHAQNIADVGAIFEKVNPSVVVIRAKGRDVTGTGLVGFTEIGSGVLISADGKVMTAAHVTQALDDITVEFMAARPCARDSGGGAGG